MTMLHKSTRLDLIELRQVNTQKNESMRVSQKVKFV